MGKGRRCGPSLRTTRTVFPDCYWVQEGRLLAGEYPGRAGTPETRRSIARLRQLGVTLFVDLTEPGEYGLVPYQPELDEGMRAIRKPVPDFGCPSAAEMGEILDLIDAEIAAGGVVYVHCYGGVGRTGTVVGCFLVRHGASPKDALAAISRLRAGTRTAARSSPETEVQREMILSWSTD